MSSSCSMSHCHSRSGGLGSNPRKAQRRPDARSQRRRTHPTNIHAKQGGTVGNTSTRMGGSPCPDSLAGTTRTNEPKEGRRHLSKSALDRCWGLLGFLSHLRASEATTPERAGTGRVWPMKGWAWTFLSGAREPSKRMLERGANFDPRNVATFGAHLFRPFFLVQKKSTSNSNPQIHAKFPTWFVLQSLASKTSFCLAASAHFPCVLAHLSPSTI